MRRSDICPVCRRYRIGRRLMCDPCGRSYDRALARDETTIALIEWAARRARRFARLGAR